MNTRKSQLIGMAVVIVAVLAAFSLTSPTQPAVAQTALYKSCQEDKLTAPISLQSASATAAATAAASAATADATQAAEPASGSDNILFLSIVGSQSEACYLASEVFLEGNMMGIKAGFNGAVGVTKTIKGDIALDKNNVANSQIGDLTINISEFKSDNDRRDGFIRRNFLESNKYPFATLTEATAIGLPTGAYTDGTELKFKVKGILTVHDTKRDTTFDATGSYKNGALVVRAVTDLKMSDFGVQVPNIANLLKVDDPIRLVINLVARVQQGTPAAK